MKLLLYVAAALAMSPFVLMFAVLAKALRAKRTPPMGTIGEDPIGDDPGVDVDKCSVCSAPNCCAVGPGHVY